MSHRCSVFGFEWDFVLTCAVTAQLVCVHKGSVSHRLIVFAVVSGTGGRADMGTLLT